MKAKGKNTSKAIKEHRVSDTGASQIKNDSIALVLLSIYLLVDFIPYLGAIDVRGPQWLYLSLVNLIVAFYFLTKSKTNLKKHFNIISGDTLTISYILLFVLCGFSIFFAINKIEAIVAYSRFAISIIAFLNFVILMYGRIHILKRLFQIVTVLVLIQSIPVIYTFIENIDTSSSSTLILGLTGNTGNKNVLAASLAFKLPIILYCLHNFHSPLRNLINLTSLSLTTFLIFILNARAAYLGLLIQSIIYVSLLLYFNLELLSRRQKTSRLIKFLLPLIIVFFTAQSTLRYIEFRDPNAVYGTITKRLGTLSDPTEAAGGRFFFWSNAIDYIKKHPFTGSGYGNWKIVSVEYEKNYNNNFDFSKQVHNDFLQNTAESGIIAGLCFIAVFVLAFIYVRKTLKSDSDNDLKNISLFAALAVCSYFVDAIFNFPAERPIMQIYFVFALAIIVSAAKNPTSTVQNVQNQVKLLIPTLTVFLILILGSIFISHSTYKSMKTQLKVQLLIRNNYNLENVRISSQDINSDFPSIPNLAENNMPIDVIKAWLAFNEGKNEEALALTNRSINVNPYAGYNEFVKASIYFSMNTIDSAYHYSRKGFYNRPRNSELFNMLAKACVQKKDSETLKEAFKIFRKYANYPRSWKIYIRSLFAINKDQEEVIRLSDSISKVFPENAEIQHTRYFVKANLSALKKDFKTALENLEGIMKLYPNDIENVENIGLTYYYMANYLMAMKYFEKVVLSRAYNNGKSEFFLAKCLLNMGSSDSACTYLQMAAQRNYPGASQQFNDLNCKTTGIGPAVKLFKP